jgi:5-hydroxyisourate hydrolase-like protein (transthyretin family)
MSFTVAGRVTDAVTGSPVAGARVELSRMEVVVDGAGAMGAESRTATSDVRGLFSFANLRDGDYAVVVEKSGYVRYPDMFDLSSQPLHLSSGRPAADLRIALQKGAVFTGTLTDLGGEPAEGLQVAALRQVTEGGQSIWLPAGQATTDDLGHFRIWGIAAGQYLVAASDGFRGRRRDVPPSSTTNVQTYYPGTGDQNTAQVFSLAPGQTVDGLRFSLVSASAFSITGVVVDGSGKPVPRASLTLFPVPSPMSPMMSPPHMSEAAADGTFRFTTIGSGDYLILVSDPDGGGGGLAGFSVGFGAEIEESSAGSVRLPAAPNQTRVKVANADVANLRVVLTRDTNR